MTKDKNSNSAGPEDVILLLASGQASDCESRCKAQYHEDLKKCNDDLDCIQRATGRYVLCVLSCRM